MFRTVLYQLLNQVVPVRAMFDAAWNERQQAQGAEGYSRDWQLDELRDLFSRIVLEAAKLQNIRLFIDALDEAGEEAAKDLLSYIWSLNDEIRSSEARISICFSCRRYPVFANHGKETS